MNPPLSTSLPIAGRVSPPPMRSCAAAKEAVQQPADYAPPMVRFTFVAVLMLTAGCPSGSSRPPSKACEKAYEQCVLPSGVLGVCDIATCQPGQPEPCLVCRSQH